MPMKASWSISRMVCSMRRASSWGVRPRSRTRIFPASTWSRMNRIFSSVVMVSTFSADTRLMLSGGGLAPPLPSCFDMGSPEVLGDGLVEGIHVRSLAGGDGHHGVLREGRLQGRGARLGEVDLVRDDDDRELAGLEVAEDCDVHLREGVLRAVH